MGLHLAWKLRDSGRDVILVEGARIGTGATALSTAKVAVQHGTRWSTLAGRFGVEKLRPYARANATAVDRIGCILADLSPAVPHARKPAVLFTQDHDTSAIHDEFAAAEELGLDVQHLDPLMVPVPATAALAIPDQIEIEPVGYCRALAQGLAGRLRLFQDSRVQEIKPGARVQLKGKGFDIWAAHVVIATHLPVHSPGLVSARAFPFAHPVVAAPAPEGVPLEGMYLSASQPSRSFRELMVGTERWLLAAGTEFRLGDPVEQAEAMADLCGFLARAFGIKDPPRRWVNHDYRSFDGLPLVGAPDEDQPNLMIGTGFSAWCFTASWVAAEVLAARLTGHDHPCADLLHADRNPRLQDLPRAALENLETGYELAAGKLKGATGPAVADLAQGQGTILRDGIELVAVSRGADGALTALSAACTHLGCTVRWNEADRTWDCPCHGSRFAADGQVIAGPAAHPLERREVPPA